VRARGGTLLGLAIAALFGLAGCGDDPAPRVPARSAPRITRREDGQVVFQASVFVELHVWLVFLALHPGTHVPEPAAGARAAYAAALEGEPSDALARSTTERLAACDDLACAKAALAPAHLDGPFEAALPYFEGNIWPRALEHADRALSRLRAALPDSLGALVVALAKELAADEKTTARLDVVHESPLYADDPLAPLALEDTAPCLRGRREDDPEALACALFQVALAMRASSRVYQSIDAAAERSEEGRRRTMRLYALAAAHATRIVARAGSGTAKESFTAALLAREPAAVDVLARRWAERTTADFARALSQAVSR